jgi:hypothetical protein
MQQSQAQAQTQPPPKFYGGRGILGYRDRVVHVTKEYGSSWILERYLTWANALRRVQCSVFSLVATPRTREA